MSNINDEKKQLLLGRISDAVHDVLYYDRKDDDELHYHEVAELIESGYITFDEMIGAFTKSLSEARKNNYSLYEKQRPCGLCHGKMYREINGVATVCPVCCGSGINGT